MEFRTVVPAVEGQKGLVRHGEPLLLVGSCFSDNIGACLSSDLFDADVNPFGPLYNPVSIRNAFTILRDETEVDPATMLQRDGIWVSTLFHSRISDGDRQRAQERMNSRIHASASTLREASVIIITLGTTRIFSLRESRQIVANCHKLPGTDFDVRYLSLDETIVALRDTVSLIREANHAAHIIFTVSPLRYNEQGAHGNQIAKATLMLAVDCIVKENVDGTVSYFPAYEVMMDDLRDYRFYAEDMKHPSAQAIRYIYDLFRRSYFDEETIRLSEEAMKFTRRMAHRSLAGESPASQESNIEKIKFAESFTARFPKLKRACERYVDNIPT